MLIKIENLNIGFESNPILQTNINFSIDTNSRIINICGNNGTGKTCLLQTIVGFTKPLSGKIFLFDKELSCYTPKERSSFISYAPTASQFPIETPFLTLQELLFNISSKSKYALSLVSRLKLNNFLNNNFIELSDGQKSKALILRSILMNPTLLILDEPTSHLDIESKLELFHILKDWICENENRGIIFSSHDFVPDMIKELMIKVELI